MGVAGFAGIITVPFPGHNPGLDGLLFILPVLSGVLGGLLGLVAVVLKSRPAVMGCLLAVASLFALILKPPPVPVGTESGAIGDLRNIVSAEVAYATVNEGRYDTLECLHQPTRCLPAYPATGHVFLSESFLVAQRRGYTFAFHPGEPAPGGPSSSAMKSFAYVAVPIKVGRTGGRGFCIDADGVICETDGRPPTVVRGECVMSAESGCAALR